MDLEHGSLKLEAEGLGPLTLHERDYVTAGGEGRIYRQHDVGIKLYADPAKMTRDRMGEKLARLQGLHHPAIIGPRGLVWDRAGQPLGFHMPWAKGEPLIRLFGNDFRTRVGFGTPATLKVVAGMQAAVQAAHAHGAVMVDANELNWLVALENPRDPKPFVIDVDSWAIGPWPASVIMPSIRDWHTRGFSAQTDWFAWGIVTFQLFVGIHPYKGILEGYRRGDLEARMRAKASVFAPGVRLPQAVRDFSLIPGRLLEWYQATFQQGLREPPPVRYDQGAPAKLAQVQRLVGKAQGALVFTKLFRHPGDPVLQLWPSGAARLASGTLVDLTQGQALATNVVAGDEVVRLAEGWLLAQMRNGQPVCTWLSSSGKAGVQALNLPIQLRVRRFLRAFGQLYALTDHELVELNLLPSSYPGRPPLLTFGRTWGLFANATDWYQNVAVVDLLGAKHLYVLRPEGGMVQVRTPELDGVRVLNAMAGPRYVAVMAADRQGHYHQLEFTFGPTGSAYQLERTAPDSPELNLAILPHGVVAKLVRDGLLEVYVPSNGTRKQVEDRDLTTDLTLMTWGPKVVYLKDGDIWQVQMT